MEKHEALRCYLAGCAWGEGCFSVSIGRRGKRTAFRFSVAQHERDKGTLELFKKELGCGSIILDTSKGRIRRYRVWKQKDLAEKVIPYFDGILTGYKKEQFKKWKKEFLSHIRKRLLTK